MRGGKHVRTLTWRKKLSDGCCIGLSDGRWDEKDRDNQRWQRGVMGQQGGGRGWGGSLYWHTVSL